MTAPRNFSNTARTATLAASLSTSAVEAVLDSFTGFPSPPFAATIDRNQPTEEIVLVTAVTGETATLTRGFDGSSVQAHSAGAGFEHTAIAADFRAAGQAVADAAAAASAAGTAQTAANAAQSTANTANTGLGTHTAATAAHGATGAVVGTTNTQVLTNKTVKAPVFQKSDGSALVFVESTEKGAVNGVATLGADGKVPAAQLPSGGSSVLYGSTTAGTTITAAGGTRFPIGLDVVGLTPGRWLIECEAVCGNSNAANGTSLEIKAASGLVATAGAYFPARATAASSGVTTSTSQWSGSPGTVGVTFVNGIVGLGGGSTRGVLAVTTGGDLTVSAFSGSSGSDVKPGAWLRATKIA